MIRSRRTPYVKMINDINITPFTDVVLVLLIIFMVTASSFIKESSFNLKLPKAANVNTPLPTSITVRINAERQYFFNNEPAKFEQLSAMIAAHHQKFGTRLLVIKADEGIPYQYVVSAIDVARQAGVDQIALATRQPQ